MSSIPSTAAPTKPVAKALGNHALPSHKSSPERNVIHTHTWSGPDDPENPYNWPSARKWFVAGIALVGTLLMPLNGTSITVAASALSAEFSVQDTALFTNTYWMVTSWSLGGSLFILVLLPLMEDTGVRRGYLAIYIFFILMIVPQALARNFATLVVTRFFSGGCVALGANTIASIIPDLWEGDRARSVPVSIYILLYMVGSTLGPPLFGPVMQYIGDWRWIFYIQLIIYGAYLPILIIWLRETRGDVILRRRAQKLRKETSALTFAAVELNTPSLRRRLLIASYRPAYLLFTEPVLFASTVWSAFAFGTVFLFTQSVGTVFSSLYAWPEFRTGYIQAAVVLGELLGWLFSFPSRGLYLGSRARNPERPGHPIPEARLYVSIPASVLGITGGMFVYAWTSFSSLPWIAPALGLVMVGAGIQVVVLAVADYITDAYAGSGYAGSAISAVAAGENLFAGLWPLAAASMYANLGFQWASSLLGVLALALTGAPVLFVWKGRWLRERSPFMSAGREQVGEEKVCNGSDASVDV